MPGTRGPGREAQAGCDPLCSQASREKGSPRECWRWQLQRGEAAGSRVSQRREGRRAWVTGWACAGLWAAEGARPQSRRASLGPTRRGEPSQGAPNTKQARAPPPEGLTGAVLPPTSCPVSRGRRAGPRLRPLCSAGCGTGGGPQPGATCAGPHFPTLQLWF